MNLYNPQRQLDILRATITSCCLSQNMEVIPTHFNRIDHVSKVFGFKGALNECLGFLADLEEISELSKSYWVPVRSRSINLGDLWMIASSYPTEQLPNKCRPRYLSGFARAADCPLDGFPIQNLNDWLGSKQSVLAWLQGEMRLAAKTLRETAYAIEDVEFYTPWIKERTVRSTYRNWKNAGVIGAGEKGQLMLGRYKGSFFWGALDSGRLLESGKVFDRNELIKTQIGIEKLFGLEGRSVKFMMSGNRFSISSKLKLPEQLRRLFVAIGDRNIESDDEIYSFSSEYLDSVQNQLGIFNIRLT